jgi:hypothetical protein
MTMKIDPSTQNQATAIEPGGMASPSNTTPSAAPESLMPDVDQLGCSGDPGAMVAALAMTTAKDERKVARAERDQALDAQDKAEAAEIQDLHDKADLQRAQGVVSGLLQAAQGVCDTVAGVYEAHEATDKDAQLQKDRTVKNDLKGVGGAFGVGKTMSDGVFNGNITDKDADSKAHGVAADTFKRIADDAHDSDTDAKALLDKALDFYKEYQDTLHQTTMAAIHRA